jgi:hypothetical protein
MTGSQPLRSSGLPRFFSYPPKLRTKLLSRATFIYQFLIVITLSIG